MAKGKGYEGTVVIKRATTWGTAVAGGALDGAEVLTVGLIANRGIIPDQSITGMGTHREGDKGNIVAGGNITAPLRYENATQRAIAQVMGTAGAPSTVDTSAKQHVLKIKPNVDGLFSTVAYEILKDTTEYEFPSVKFTGFSIKVTIPGRIELEVRAIAHTFTDASAVNTTSSMDSVTGSANLEIAQARQLVVLMNAQAGAGLAGSDAIHLTNYELNVDRPLQADFTTEFGDKSSEPMPPSGGDPFLKVTGSMTFSQYQTSTGGNNALALEQLNRTLKKMTATLTGDNLAGAATQKFQYTLWLPMVVLGDGKPTLSAGALGWQIPFESHHVSAIPTGFTAGYTDALTIDIFNKSAVDLLA